MPIHHTFPYKWRSKWPQMRPLKTKLKKRVVFFIKKLIKLWVQQWNFILFLFFFFLLKRNETNLWKRYMLAVTLYVILFEHVSVLKIHGAMERIRGWWTYICMFVLFSFSILDICFWFLLEAGPWDIGFLFKNVKLKTSYFHAVISQVTIRHNKQVICLFVKSQRF